VLSRLHAIVDVDVASRAGWTPIDLAHAVLDGGATVLQVRAKHLSSSACLDLADAVLRIADLHHAVVVINDRVDIARMSGAAGVHVGQDDVPPAAARRLLGGRAIIGFSTHTVEQIEAAVGEPISYLAVGPVFGTRTKETGYEAVGLELVSTAARLTRGVAIVGIGGITLENAHSVVAAGASSVAVISDLLVGNDPRRRTEAFLRSLADNRV
jgi:thiamine-phosphate pyrophosphorylase